MVIKNVSNDFESKHTSSFTVNFFRQNFMLQPLLVLSLSTLFANIFHTIVQSLNIWHIKASDFKCEYSIYLSFRFSMAQCVCFYVSLSRNKREKCQNDHTDLPIHKHTYSHSLFAAFDSSLFFLSCTRVLPLYPRYTRFFRNQAKHTFNKVIFVFCKHEVSKHTLNCYQSCARL